MNLEKSTLNVSLKKNLYFIRPYSVATKTLPELFCVYK